MCSHRLQSVSQLNTLGLSKDIRDNILDLQKAKTGYKTISEELREKVTTGGVIFCRSLIQLNDHKTKKQIYYKN